MDRAVALSRLQAQTDVVRSMRATSLYLYGSTARGDATAASDVDLYIEYDPSGDFNAFDLVGIKQFLEERLGSTVDLTTRDSLHPRLRERIEQSAIRVF